MVNILYYAEELSVGGVENMMYQWANYIRSCFHVDIFVCRIKDRKYVEMFNMIGCDVFEANCSAKDILTKYRYLNRLLKKKHYDIIHVHTSMATDFFVLSLAKKRGIQHRIAHSHNVPLIPKKTTKIADKLCKPLLRYYATDFFGCSKASIAALFGDDAIYNDYHIIKNGIKTNNYAFDNKKRSEARKQFKANEKTFVIGSVGRLDFQKDYFYLLKIVNMAKEKEKIKIVIIGDGDERKNLEEYSRKHNIDLCLLGTRSDVDKLLNGFDLFVLTSRFEGFPVVMMEAQANGLKCIVSEAVPNEAILSDESKIIFKKNENEWVNCIDKIVNHYNCNCLKTRVINGKIVKKQGYDINDCAQEMLRIYQSMLNKQYRCK